MHRSNKLRKRTVTITPNPADMDEQVVVEESLRGQNTDTFRAHNRTALPEAVSNAEALLVERREEKNVCQHTFHHLNNADPSRIQRLIMINVVGVGCTVPRGRDQDCGPLAQRLHTTWIPMSHIRLVSGLLL